MRIESNAQHAHMMRTGHTCGHGKHKVEANHKQAASQVDTYEPTGKMPGVIRNLLTGHYKGVASARLWIVHHRRIRAIQQSAIQDTLSSGVQSLQELVKTQTAQFLDTQELTDEQQQAIDEQAEQFNASLEVIAQQQSGDPEGLVSLLNDAFQQFVDGLGSIIEPQPITEPDEPIVDQHEPVQPVEPVDELTIEEPIDQPVDETQQPTTNSQPITEDPPLLSPFQQFVTDLEQLYTDSVSDLIANVQNVDIFPRLSPPTGGGRAYDKFVSILQMLYGMNEPAEKPAKPLQSEEPPIDILA